MLYLEGFLLSFKFKKLKGTLLEPLFYSLL